MLLYNTFKLSWFRGFVITVCFLLLAGCANLETVRDFAKQSASLASGSEAIDYWGKWGERSKRFDVVVARLPPHSGKKPEGVFGPITVPTKDEISAIKALQSVLSAYMSKLGALADDNLTDVSKQVDGLVENLNKLPSDMPEEKLKKVNTAYGTIIKLVKLPLEVYRHYEVRKLIQDNDENIKLLTEGLSSAIASLEKFSEQEKNSVLNWYEVTTNDYPEDKNFSSAYQWEKDRASIIQTYQGKTAALESYQQALRTISASHHKMAQDLGLFDSDSFKRLASSLVDARDQIVSAQNQYRKAFE